ncbi:MAG: DUF421 domain-containing protein [Clostridia bacterium]|nr:DUF421 domain-containing protein [Clostridia bacterium]
MLITLARSVILYLLLIFTVRLMGKRQIGQLQPGELVITILISEIAVIPMQDNDLPMAHSVLALLLLAAFEIIMSAVALKSSKIRRLLQGNSVIIIKDGVLDQKQLKKLRYTIDDLLEALRQKNVFDISEVQYAIAETDGTLSILLKPEKRTVTIENAKLKPTDDAFKSVLVADGEILNAELESIGMTKTQLKAMLNGKGLSVKNILLLETDKNGNTNIIEKEKN